MSDLDFSGLNSSWGIGKQKSGDNNKKSGTGKFSSGKGGNYSKSSGKDGFQKNRGYQGKKGDYKDFTIDELCPHFFGESNLE